MNNEKHLHGRIQTLTYRYAASLILLFGFALVLFDEQLEVLGLSIEIVNQIGLSIIPAGIIALIVDKLIRETFSEKISSEIDLSVKDAVSVCKGMQEAGIKKIKQGLTDDDIEAPIKAASKLIRIQQTWIPNRSKINEEIVLAARRGCKVHILMLDPELEMATSRSNDLGMSDRHVSDEIDATLKSLKKHWLKHGKPHNIEVRLHNCIPSQFLYQIDEKLYTGVFFVEKEGINGPVFELEEKVGYCSEVLINNFNLIWKNYSTECEIEKIQLNG